MTNLVTTINNPPKHEFVLMRERGCLTRGRLSAEVWIVSTQEEYDRISMMRDIKLDIAPHRITDDIWLLEIEVHNIYNTRANNKEFVIYADNVSVVVRDGNNIIHSTRADLQEVYYELNRNDR